MVPDLSGIVIAAAYNIVNYIRSLLAMVSSLH
jgi:hypothetical protein